MRALCRSRPYDRILLYVAAPPKATRFFGTKKLNADRYVLDFKKIAEGPRTPGRRTGPTASAIRLIGHVPDETNRRHRRPLRLIDADGVHVEADQADGRPFLVALSVDFQLPHVSLAGRQRERSDRNREGHAQRGRLPFDIRPAQIVDSPAKPRCRMAWRPRRADLASNKRRCGMPCGMARHVRPSGGVP
jgi:hypothetical protein